MENIATIDFWKQQFGLYPLLFNHKVKDSKYLMLNGGNKDFCLQTNIMLGEEESYFTDSWSTNTKNFIALQKDIVHIYNWYEGKSEKHEIAKIVDNPDKFYAYLSTKSYKTSIDAVPFIIDIFRQLRNLVGKKDPEESLSLLFKLLISIDEDYSKIDSSKWDILDISLPSNFGYYVDLIRQGVNSISPNRDLILRHIAGALFQEAHKEVIYFDPQIDLWGGFSNKIITKTDSYSSVHYTPSYLARTIVERCLIQLDLTKRNLKIFDPACGSSEFLIETLKQLKNLDYTGNVEVVGWDTSSSAVCTSRFLLKYEEQTQWDSKSLKFQIKKVSDSLTEEWDHDYDLIVMNPPFVSWELLDRNNREAIMEALGLSSTDGKPNQASAFFYKAAKSLRNGGVIGCVLPSSIFISDSYKKLRNEFQEEFTLNILAKLGNYVFENALTDVSFLVGQKSKSTNLPELIWTKNQKGTVQDVLCNLRKKEYNHLPTVEDKNYSIYTPSTFPVVNESWKIISSKEERFLKDIKRFEIDGLLTSISDIFKVQQGLRQGKRNIFKVSKSEYESMLEEEKALFRPVVDNDAIKNGQLFDHKYIWYPYNASGIIFKTEEEMEDISFFREKLKPVEAELKKRAGIQEWWGHTRPRNWQFVNHPKLISTEFGKSDSFAFDRDGDFVVERGCGWIPKKNFNTDDYYFYLAVFSSNFFDFLLSIYSKPIQSGYYLGQVYTKNIPVPNIRRVELKDSEPYNRLVELGKELEAGNTYVKYAIDDVLKTYYPIV